VYKSAHLRPEEVEEINKSHYVQYVYCCIWQLENVGNEDLPESQRVSKERGCGMLRAVAMSEPVSKS